MIFLLFFFFSNDQRIVIHSHIRKAPHQTVAQGEGHSVPRRVPKSTKKVRAPPLPPSAFPPLSELNKNQNLSRDVLSSEKTPSPEVVSRSISQSPAVTDQPQRPPRQKRESDSLASQKTEKTLLSSSLVSSSGQFDDVKSRPSEIILSGQLTNIETSNSGAPKTYSSKKRPAPLPNQPPPLQTIKLPLNSGLQQAVSEFSNSQVGGDDILAARMPSQVSERSGQSDVRPSKIRQPIARDFTSDSGPPPLPSSAPPPLPSSPPPLAAKDPLATPKSADSTEELSIEYTVPISLSSSEFVSGILDAPSSSRRSTFDSNKDQILKGTDENETEPVNFSGEGLKGPQAISTWGNSFRERKPSAELDSDNSFDSDISNEDVSNEENKGGTYDFFSPGKCWAH